MAVQYFPFKGIVKERPYPPTGLTTLRWALETRVQIVPLENLFLTQGGVFIEPLFRSQGSHCGDDMPHVVLWRGNFYLEDGHHRRSSRSYGRPQSYLGESLYSAA